MKIRSISSLAALAFLVLACEKEKTLIAPPPVPLLCQDLFTKLQNKDVSAFSGDWALDPEVVWKIGKDGQIYWSHRDHYFLNTHKEGSITFQDDTLSFLGARIFPSELSSSGIVRVGCSVRAGSKDIKASQILDFVTDKGFSFSLARQLESSELKTDACYDYVLKTRQYGPCKF